MSLTKSTITLADGTELSTIAVYQSKTDFQSANRQILEIQIPSNATTFDELRALFVKDNLGEIILTETTTYDPEITEDGETVEVAPTINKYQHLNYSLVKEIAFRESESMYVVTIAQRTELEIAQEEQGAILTALLQGV